MTNFQDLRTDNVFTSLRRSCSNPKSLFLHNECVSPKFVVHSVFDGKYLIENILINYLKDRPISCKLYKRGLNDTYLVEGEFERYILRVYRRQWRNKQEIDFELELLDFLQKNHQPVASPIPMGNGVFTTEVDAPEGVRYAAVCPYTPSIVNSTHS